MEFSTVYQILGAILAIYIYKNWNKKKQVKLPAGTPTKKPLPVVGNFLPIILQKCSMLDLIDQLYYEFYDKKFFGLFTFWQEPMLVVTDPELIKQIGVKDSDYFTNRGPKEIGEIDKITGRSILFTHDQEWKDMRNVLNPMYTSAKLRQIFYELKDCVFDAVKFYEEKAQNNGRGTAILETHKSMARITADGIARTALGFKADSTRDENCEVYDMANDIEQSFTFSIRGILFQIIPKIMVFFGFQVFSMKVQLWFQKNVLHEMNRRERLNIQKPDAIHQFLTAKETGKWTDNDFVAQGVTLFLGGFGTTTNLMDGLFFELAKNRDVQETLIQEVDEMLKNLNGEEISYDQLNQMKFMEMVVNEGLRKWGPTRGTARYCGKDYTFTSDGKTYEIQKGTNVFLNFGSFMMDPNYFPDPKKFDPQRFSDENKKNIVPGTFTPFGMGQRICLGSRYAYMDAKLILFAIFSKFTVEQCGITPEKINYDLSGGRIEQKICVGLKLRQQLR